MKKIVRKFIDSIVFKIIPEVKFLREHNDFMFSQISTSNKINNIRINATIFNEEDYSIGSFSCPNTFSVKKREIKKISLKIINHNLALGNYSISTSIGIGDFIDGMIDFDIIRNILNFSIFKYSIKSDVGYNNWEKSWGSFVFKTEAVEIK